VLRDVADKSGESVFLGVLTASPPEVVYVDKVESRQRIRYTASLGERRPLYCTAPGLAVFAFLPVTEQGRLLESLDLVPFTDVTITDRAALRVRLDEIRSAGVAVNIDEFIAGAGGVAAPIFDAHGAPVAACTVIGPTPRLLAQRDALVRWVKAAGDAISRGLGCPAAAPRPS
jgi:DNA-binding IclR family transcriptional regulator